MSTSGGGARNKENHTCIQPFEKAVCALHFRKGEAGVPLTGGDWKLECFQALSLALVLRRLCSELAFTMEPAHVLLLRCEFDFVFQDTAVFVACFVVSYI